MSTFTRRTHVVRIGPPNTPAGQKPTVFVDVEVLDAISFKTTNGEEMIIDFAGGRIEPYIIDNTGDGNQKTPSAATATRRSHMERITSADGTSFFDVEVLDCIAFRGTNGDEWILNMPAEGDPDAKNPEAEANEYNTTTKSGPANATRRVHFEKISEDLKDPHPTQYLRVTRTDMVAFRSVFGRQMIVNMASNDDPLSSDPRAKTVMTPKGYNPSDNSPNAVVPPKNKDKNIYAFFPPNSAPFTLDKRIAQGPLWWIRKIGSNTSYGIIVSISGVSNSTSTVPPPLPGLSGSGWRTEEDPGNATILNSRTEVDDPPTVTRLDTTVWFVWNSAAPFPDLTNYNNIIPAFGAPGVPYIGQFGLGLVFPGSGTGRTSSALAGWSATGTWGTEDSAQIFADAWEAEFGSDFAHGYARPDGSLDETIPGAVSTLFVASLTIPGGTSSISDNATFDIQIPSDGSAANLTFTVSVTGGGDTAISVEGGGPDSGETGGRRSGTTTYGVTAFVQNPGTPDAEIIVNVTGGSGGGGVTG